MKEALVKLIAQILGMKFAYHNAHLLAKNPQFFADHAALGEFYSALESDFDSVSERLIGLFGPEAFSLALILQQAMVKLPQAPAPDNATYFSQGLQQEQELQQLGGMICKLPECSEGTKQLIGNILDDSESRVYKIKQRLRK